MSDEKKKEPRWTEQRGVWWWGTTPTVGSTMPTIPEFEPHFVPRDVFDRMEGAPCLFENGREYRTKEGAMHDLLNATAAVLAERTTKPREVKLGQPPTPDAGRDAVHVAVIALKALFPVWRGQRLKNGIVDPFMKSEVVQPGEWFWLCLYPETTTSLRHVWSHPAFPDEPAVPEKKRSERDVWFDALGLEGEKK